MKKRRLKKQYKIVLYVLLTILFMLLFINTFKIDPDQEKAINNCIEQGNGQNYCYRNYGNN